MLAGYHCSLFAYGQTGSGKSYSMMGYGEAKGIIPIACERIFDRCASNTDPNLTIKVQCSMLEIYMEKVRDLFNPSAGNLNVRMDPKIGFYVQDLTMSSVSTYAQISAVRACVCVCACVSACGGGGGGVYAHAWHA